MRRRATTRRLRRTMLAGVALFAVAMVVLLDATNAFDRAELSTVDTRFEIRGERPVPNDVVVVGIDDVTFSELNERFPFSRLTFARALSQISRDRPRAIVYDIEFAETSGDSRGRDQGRQRARARHAPRRQRRPQRHGGRQERRHQDLRRRQGGPEVRAGDGRQRAAARGLRRCAAPAAVLDRRPEDAVGGDRRARHPPAGRPQPAGGRAARGSTSRGRPATSATSRSRTPSSAASSRARSGTGSSSSAPPRPRCRTATRPPGPPARWSGPRSTRTRSTRCCAGSPLHDSSGLADLLIALGLTLLPALLGLRLRPLLALGLGARRRDRSTSSSSSSRSGGA